MFDRAEAEFRVAIYYAPLPDDPLTEAGAVWLGRDPASGASRTQPGLPGFAEVTADPRRYGFHGTLKPPMRLAPGRGWSDLIGLARVVADRIAPFELPKLHVADLSGFLALREVVPCPSLQALADACVEGIEPLRAAPSSEELARRRAAGLIAQQEAMLVRWGYPYVFGTWFFHMTLTRRLTPEEKAFWLPEAERHFEPSLSAARWVTDICLFTQRTPEEAFVLAERIPLRG